MYVSPSPKQARARATVEKIQQAAKELLAEGGADGLNTNAIADRAGVNVATLYNYYSDKYAILAHLFAQFEEQRANYVRQRILEVERGADRRGWVESVIDRLAEMRTQGPFEMALRRALATVPALADLDRHSAAKIAGELEAALVRGGDLADDAPVAEVAELIVDVVTHTLDSAFSTSPPDAAKVEELKVMVNAYLAVRRVTAD